MIREWGATQGLKPIVIIVLLIFMVYAIVKHHMENN